MNSGVRGSSSSNNNNSINSSKNLMRSTRVFEALDVSKVFPQDFKNVSANEEDLFVSFRGLLILGRFLGIISIGGLFQKSQKQLHTKFLHFGSLLSVPGITSMICVTFLSLNACMAIGNSIKEPKKSILSIANSVKNPLFACWGLFIYVYFLIRRREFIKIFQMWAKVSRGLVYTQKDKFLKRTIVIISVFMFSSTFLENAILHLEYFEAFDDINGHTLKYGKEMGNVPVLKMYYYRSHSYWNIFLGYHPILAVIVFFVHKWILYGWNYIDVTSALFFRALYFKFKALCTVAEENLLQPMALEKPDKYTPSDADRLSWDQLAKDHDSLCELLDVMNHFFSPLIFVSYTVNIYFFCMQLLFGLNPDSVNHSIVHSVYAPWSFIHIILRIFIFSFFGSKINEFAHKIRDVVMRCPVELHTGSMAKLDKRVNIGPQLGITGLGCFTITKPFMLSILNVVFTIEIVLLQGLSNEKDKKDGCTKQ